MFRAEVDGRPLTFDLAGLIGANFVMRDRETRSRWQQATGEAISGALQGSRLKLIPFLLTSWAEWRTQHPQTQVLEPVPGFETQYDRMRRRVEQLQWGGRGFGESPGALRHDPRLADREQIVGLETGGAHKAYPLAVLRKVSVVNDQVGTTPVLLIHIPESDTTTAFSRLVKGRILTFRPADSKVHALLDGETGSRWTAYGECVAGPLKGAQLTTLIPLPSFWFSWAEFFPDTQLYSAGAK